MTAIAVAATMSKVSANANANAQAQAQGGLFAGNLVGFCRALRRAGLPLDAARIALAQQAMLWTGIEDPDDFCAALEAVLVSREPDRWVFRALWGVYFFQPVSNNLWPMAAVPDDAEPQLAQHHPRVQDALTPARHGEAAGRPDLCDKEVEREDDLVIALAASELQRLRQADFNALNAAEYHHVERLAREVPLPIPCISTRRTRPGNQGKRLHWPGVMHRAAQTGGEMLHLPKMQRRQQPLPLLVLVDVSGSMARYARLLLAFVHTATRHLRQRDVFAFGTDLTDLTPTFALKDTDAMLASARQLMTEFAGGTRLGQSLATLRRGYARRLLGRRTLVLLVTDGLDTGEPAALAQELDWLRRHSRRVLWLNPLLRFDGYAPTARGPAVLQSQVHGALAVHNLEHLRDLAQGIADVLKR